MVGHPARRETTGGKAGAWGGVGNAGEGWKDSGKCGLGSDGERRDAAARNCALVSLAIRPVQEELGKALPSHCTGDKTEAQPCSDLPKDWPVLQRRSLPVCGWLSRDHSEKKSPVFCCVVKVNV